MTVHRGRLSVATLGLLVLAVAAGAVGCSDTPASTPSSVASAVPLAAEQVELVWLGVSNWLVRYGDTG